MQHMRKFMIGLFALVVISSVSAQTGSDTHTQTSAYAFKGNTLGMSLADFKVANNQGTVYINTGKPNWRGKADPKLTQAVPTPLCTDVYDGLQWPVTAEEGEVLCNASPGAINAQGRRISGVDAMSVTYHFYHQQLAKISIVFSTANYSQIRSAFVAKYGEPSSLSTRQFQNGFGARWEAELTVWRKGKQASLTMSAVSITF